jgi:plasmid maintenance system antidote protein VapI
MKKLRQIQIAEKLGISQAMVSLILAGKRPITWPLAVKLSDLFPGKSLRQWKEAGPDDLMKALRTLTLGDE